jgi:6-phosphogluconate dehydrogenase
MEAKSVFGVYGLGVMGSSISLNIADKGYALSVCNRTEAGEETVVKDFMDTHRHRKNIQGFTDLKNFVASLQRPRKILLMIKAGSTVDLVLDQLIPLLSKGDVIIDGGNSHYLNTKRRYELAGSQGIEFIGAGISGGEEGARKGPSIMPGGTKEGYDLVAGVLESIAAPDDSGKTCCAYIGPDGAGHFIKMVHNGIEYVEMQLLAEVYALMSVNMPYDEMASTLEDWNQGESSSYLLEITVKILRKKEGDAYLLDLILDKAGNKGTGSWSSKAALDLGVPSTMMSEAVFARYISSLKEQREKYSKFAAPSRHQKKSPDLSLLRKAYHFARVINHQQGFQLMELASETYGWELNFSEIARIWSNGCIIKSDLMNVLHDCFKEQSGLLDMPEMTDQLIKNEKAVKKVLAYGLEQRLSLHCFSSAYYYWVDMTTNKLPANLIQAQRDFFGAHTYQRNDRSDDQFFHTQWV